MRPGFFRDLSVAFGPDSDAAPRSDTERLIIDLVALHNRGACTVVEYEALMQECLATRDRRELAFYVPASRGDELTPMERIRYEWQCHYARLALVDEPTLPPRVLH